MFYVRWPTDLWHWLSDDLDYLYHKIAYKLYWQKTTLLPKSKYVCVCFVVLILVFVVFSRGRGVMVVLGWWERLHTASSEDKLIILIQKLSYNLTYTTWQLCLLFFVIVFQSDPSVIDRLMHSAEFSKVFDIILVNKDRQITSSMPGKRTILISLGCVHIWWYS